MDDFVERFACFPLISVSVDDLESIWLERLRSLLSHENAVALPHDPRFLWIIYRDGDTCFVQQRLAVDGNLNFIPPREIITQDGEKVSEWVVTLEAIKRFVEAT